MKIPAPTASNAVVLHHNHINPKSLNNKSKNKSKIIVKHHKIKKINIT